MFDCNYQAIGVQCYIAGAYISHLTQNPDVVSSGLGQLLLGHLLSYSVTILGTVAFIPSTPPQLPHDHMMAVDSLAILSVFQAEQKGRPKGKMFFFSCQDLLYFEKHSALLGPSAYISLARNESCGHPSCSGK